MNDDRSSRVGGHTTLRILSEISDNGFTSQRDLSSKLGIALGLVNSYLKNLIARGYIKVKSIPRRRYAYYLTPKGFSEKSRLAYHLLQNYTRIYRESRENLRKLFNELEHSGARKIVLAGSDEIAEIAYLTSQETNLELTAVVDDAKAGKKFFGREILPVHSIGSIVHDSVVITSYKEGKELYDGLLKNNVGKKDIKTIFPLNE
jgi:DNA-binding MarR family transcriptional regulator